MLLSITSYLCGYILERKKAPSTSSDRGGTSRATNSDSDLHTIDGNSSGRRRHSSFEKDCAPGEFKRGSTTSSEELDDWCLNDVVFIEDGRTQPVGVLLKVDGNFAAVKFLKVGTLLGDIL